MNSTTVQDQFTWTCNGRPATAKVTVSADGEWLADVQIEGAHVKTIVGNNHEKLYAGIDLMMESDRLYEAGYYTAGSEYVYSGADWRLAQGGRA